MAGTRGDAQDPDEIEKLRRALKESEERFHALLEAAPDAVLLVDEDRVIRLANRRAEALFEYSREQLVGRSVKMLIPERLHEAFFRGPARDLEPGSSSQEIELFCLRADGREFPVEIDRGVFQTAEGVRIFAIVREITERVHAAAQLEAARDAAEAANRAKSVFLANMSHELRTPLNAILGYSEMLTEDAEDAGQESAAADLKRIHQAGSHLLSLINDVLDLAKIESGKMEALAEDFDVESLIDDVSATAQPLMAKNDNQLRVERGEAVGRAHQDLTKLRQSLLNLLSNAAKFTREGTVTLMAERSVRDGSDWLTLSVRDSGIGIAADKLDRVFEEFGQAEETTSRDYGGTGLGLPISRRFCLMLGGDLTLESRPGEGSTFTISVPAVLPEVDVEAPVETGPARTAAELAALRETGAGRTVLVIDDDPEARDIVERLLRKDDFVVVTADSGEEGLRLAHELRPAAITLDVIMPDMDGWAVLRALKADPSLRDVPVVMLTMLDDKTRGYSLGATDYLVKPVDRDQLRSVVSRYHAPEAPGTALLVDDDPAVRETVSSALSTAGWQVETAENGRVALARLAENRPSLILLDLMMPVMDGFDFLIELHANPDWREIPVIVLTAKDLSAEDRRSLSGRVEQIVEKDTWSHEQLASLVQKLVSERPSRSPSQ
jgi:PAS domain S-box-containing protein